MSSFQTESTQPFSDISQPEADLQQLISSLPGTGGSIDLALVRIFARCHMFQKRSISICTYPDGTPATVLDHDILAVSQSIRTTACDVEMPALNEDIVETRLRLFFDPSQDAVTAENMSINAAVALQPTTSPTSLLRLMPRKYAYLQPGAWTIISSSSAGVSTPSTVLLDLYLRPRNFLASISDVASAERTGSKRPRDKAASSSKKQKAATGDRHVLTSTVSHPLLEVGDGETVRITGQDRDDNYQLTRHKHLTSTQSASLYTADYSLRPGQVVVTKALKLGYSARSTAEQWRREVSTHEGVGQHPRIVRLFGSDARYFTLYMEFVDSPSLSDYKDKSNMCTCPNAAFTILSDLADALQFIHAAGLVHNDIKPGNIIYHSTRGAILIDFGLGGPAAETNDGGTPWYLPPEYAADWKRGPPSDVFAIGVTLLWVLQKCTLPDLNEEWQIRDIHTGLFENRARAQHMMHTWLARVEKMRRGLSQAEKSLEHVVRRILRTQGRDTAEDMVEKLKSVVL